MIKTKIVCTLGPATDDPQVMRALVQGGMDVARMNFSHGDHAEQKKRLELLRSECGKAGRAIPVMLDTKGPEIRLGVFPDGPVTIQTGQQYTLTARDTACDEKQASVSYTDLPRQVKPGNGILIDDGLLHLEVVSVEGPEILCVARNSGTISSKKSINLPGVPLELPSLSERDRADILFAIKNGYDFIAASFVRKREDLQDIARFLHENGGDDIMVIAKIENSEGIDNIEEIIRFSDGIMVARGDLGVEIPVEQIPVIQKDLIRRCYEVAKPVITATQMLDSMIRNPRPTRAEVTDVANAVYDGSSAIMLSGETASGKYPAEALATMRRIAETAEQAIDYWDRFTKYAGGRSFNVTNAIGHATCTTAMDLGAAAIVAVTSSGDTARRISGYRPACPIIAATPDVRVRNQLCLSWGVCPVLVEMADSTDNLFAMSAECAKELGVAHDGDLVVLTAGVPVGMSGTTNMLKVQMIGSVLSRGKGVGTGTATGALYVAEFPGGEDFRPGDILVVKELTPEWAPQAERAAGIVVEGSDALGHARLLAEKGGIPVITGAENATKALRTGTVVAIDAARGTVRCDC